MSIPEIVELSRTYGSDPDWVLAGGGNTSYKDEATLWIKASGFSLATITEDGFAQMDRSKLQAIWDARYPEDSAGREAEALADLMAARRPGEEKRPSVETLMHELIPYPLIVHTHPALVNGVTCGLDAEEGARRVFGDQALWIPAIEPGYVLAVEMRRKVNEYERAHGAPPTIILLQNHGLVISGESSAQIKELHEATARRVQEAVARTPDLGNLPQDDSVRGWHQMIAAAFPAGSQIAFTANPELLSRARSEETFKPLSGPFSPDHIVYAGKRPVLVAGDAGAQELSEAIAAYAEQEGTAPRIVVVSGLGAFAVAESQKAADTALLLFLDEVKIAAYAESFGGARHLDSHLVEFISSWEVERYRKKLSTGGS